MSVKKIFFTVLFVVLLIRISDACVGKTIYVGHLSGKGDEIVGNILARLITERTGTSVKLKKYNDTSSLLKAGTGGEVDIFVVDDRFIAETTGLKNRDEAKNIYNVNHNLIWLKAINEKEDFLAPVIRKDTLKKFPALPRLLEKLTGLINNTQIEELKTEVEKKGMKDTIKDFLKKKSLI
ncbi:MAG: hypothetical protein N2999_00475 [Proteobacteria bacterium]|nr:hypothetical protein [Pseudomonadota bacterium]